MTSAEDKLKHLFSGFDIFLFDDDPNDKSGLVTQTYTQKEPQEIDAIAIKDNILILINIYDGNRKEQINDKLMPFFRKLKYFDDVSKLNLKISQTKTARGGRNKKYISDIMRISGNSDKIFIVKKLFFCPNLNVPKDQMSSLNYTDHVIDKKLYNYFKYALDNINYAYLERELFYFMKVEKRKLNQYRGTRIGDEPKLTGETDAIEVDLGADAKMYSICVSVKDIIEYTQVMRIANEYDVNAFQRMINKDRLKNITTHYLDKHNSFPNNIILAFNPELYDLTKTAQYIIKQDNRFKIKIYEEFGSLIIIDGQHRLLSHLLNPSRDIYKPILVNVILFKNKTKAYDQMAELFYVINTQQKRLTSLVSLKILSKLEPESTKGLWYRIFKYLNDLDERDNYLRSKICFDEKEIRENNNVSISSIISYSGINLMVEGKKVKTRKYLGLKKLAELNIGGIYPNDTEFYKNFIRKYFSIIGEVCGSNRISARDFGGLLRLIFHFINDRKTKPLFEQLSRERGEIPEILKRNIVAFLDKIPFSRLDSLDYGGNEWRSMEGFFLGCIRKDYPGFGIGSILSLKGKKALQKGKEF